MGSATRALSLGIIALALAACSSGRLPGSSTAPSEQGTYKVGTPYEIDGTWYYPNQDWNYDETGIASWYGQGFRGRYTADGEVYDLNALTAAHRTLPMPTIVRVTNLDNGRSIALRINDRGPFARGRIIDVSRRAAQLLGFERQGTAKVRVQVMVPETIEAESLAGHHVNEATLAASQPQAAPVAQVAAKPLAPPPGVEVASNQPMLPPAPPQTPPPMPPAASISVTHLPETVSYAPVRPTQIYVQAGAFASIDRAVRLKTLLGRLGNVTVAGARVAGMLMYRVRVGPVATVHAADVLLARVIATSPEARIVVN